MFSDVLKRLRINAEMNQEELAKRLGLAKSTISMYESGSREPSFEILEAIADTFNVDMNTLIGEKYILESKTFDLSHHEKRVIVAYRQQPSMQEAVDKLLGLSESEENKKLA